MSYEKVRIAELPRHQETKQRTKVVDSERRLKPRELGHERLRKTSGLFVQPLLQVWTTRFEVSEHRPGSGHCQWMFAKRAGEECLVRGWIRIVAIPPHPTVNCIHESRFTGYDADGKTTTNDFAISGQVSLHAEPRLRAAGMNAKPGDHLVEDQSRPFVGRESA